MPAPSLQSAVRRLEAKPRSSLVPFILDVFDAELPVDSARVVARCDTRTGQVWRTKGTAVRVSLHDVRDAVERSKS